jgi:hypothetical protein
MSNDNFCFYLQNRPIQTSQTGGQQYSDTSPFSIPCIDKHASLPQQQDFIMHGQGKKSNFKHDFNFFDE